MFFILRSLFIKIFHIFVLSSHRISNQTVDYNIYFVTLTHQVRPGAERAPGLFLFSAWVSRADTDIYFVTQPQWGINQLLFLQSWLCGKGLAFIPIQKKTVFQSRKAAFLFISYHFSHKHLKSTSC